MSSQLESDRPNHLTIILEIVPEDPQDVDPTIVHAIGRDTAHALRIDGYTVEPVYTGQRGGFFVDVIVPFFVTAWTQKDVILADVSELITILTPVVLITNYLRKSYENRVGKDTVHQSPMKITIETEGASISIETPDLETSEAALKFANKFQKQHPTILSKVTSQSKAKIIAHVSTRQARKRR